MISVQELVKRVRRVVNEADNDPSISLITEDRRSLDTMIKELLPQAVTLVQKNSGKGYVNVKTISPVTGSTFYYDGDKAVVAFPDDLVSLVAAKLSDWKVPSAKLHSATSATALRQVGYKTRATAARPVCVCGVRTNGERSVQFFPSTSTSKLELFVYEALFDSETGLELCDTNMADAVVYACASLLYNVFERYDASKSMLSYAMALCGNKENVKQ